MVVAARSIEHLRVEEDTDDIKGVSAVLRDEQAPRPTADVQRRPASVFDAPLEIGDLMRPEVVVELGPVPRDHAAVPRLRLFHGAILPQRVAW
jgi:hypothetical protein